MKPYCCILSIALAAAIGSIAWTGACLPANAQADSDAVVGPGGSSPNSTTTQANPPKVVVQTTMSSEFGSGVLTDKVVKRLGQPQDKLTFTVSNETKNTINYEFRSGEQIDLEIDDNAGKQMWKLSRTRLFPQLMSALTLKPGKSQNYTVLWNRRNDSGKPVPPGNYTAVATLLTMSRFVVTGTSVEDVNRDQDNPTHIGPTPPQGNAGASEGSRGGTVEQTDITPPVQAKTTIVVAPTTP